MTITRFLALAFFGFTAIATVQLAFAEWSFRNDPATGCWKRMPISNADYYERWADLDPGHARADLHNAVAVNPRSSSGWIALGLTSESEGEFPEAEHALLQAARVDRQYLPAWTLANFYFRRDHAPEFWRWAQRAAALSTSMLNPDGVQALLTLCDLLSPRLPPQEVLNRLGESPRLDRAYFDFLIRANRFDDAQQIARKMLSRLSRADTPRLMDFTDRQLHAGHGRSAMEIWNTLAVARAIRFSPIGPSRPLTNGDLSIAPTGEGFDWRLSPVEGLETEWRDSRLTFFFSGFQPEACAVLEQVLALDARRYRLRFEYSSAGMPSLTGMRWAIDSAEEPVLVSSEVWQPAEWIFTSSAGALNRLRLVYSREPGTTRAEGRFEVRNVRLDAL